MLFSGTRQESRQAGERDPSNRLGNDLSARCGPRSPACAAHKRIRSVGSEALDPEGWIRRVGSGGGASGLTIRSGSRLNWRQREQVSVERGCRPSRFCSWRSARQCSLPSSAKALATGSAVPCCRGTTCRPRPRRRTRCVSSGRCAIRTPRERSGRFARSFEAVRSSSSPRLSRPTSSSN